MTQIPPPKSNEKFIECDCHSEFVRLDYDPEFEHFDLSIWVQEASSKPSWKTKLRWIWRILTKGSPYGDQVILNKDKAKAFADYLTETMKG
jgi:hypothetical protein